MLVVKSKKCLPKTAGYHHLFKEDCTEWRYQFYGAENLLTSAIYTQKLILIILTSIEQIIYLILITFSSNYSSIIAAALSNYFSSSLQQRSCLRWSTLNFVFQRFPEFGKLKEIF